MNLIKGLFGAFRNTTAHSPKIHWNITEQDALDILTTISLVHRRLDPPFRHASLKFWPRTGNIMWSGSETVRSYVTHE